MSCRAEPLDFGVVDKHPDERLVIEFNWLPNIANVWRPGAYVAAGDIVRPSRPNGYAARCMTTGQTGWREPRWPTRDGLLLNDGSVEWLTQAANLDGLDLIMSRSITLESGVMLVDQSHTGDTVMATIQGGLDHEDYSGICEIQTQSGQRLIGVMTVRVRAKRIDSCN